MRSNNTNKLVSVVSLAIGAALGYLAGIYTPAIKRFKGRRQLQEAIPDLDWDQLSNRVFGESTGELQTKLEKTIKSFQAKLLGIKHSAQLLSTQKYSRIVDDFVTELKKDKSFTRAQLDKLREYLENDYQLVKTGAKA